MTAAGHAMHQTTVAKLEGGNRPTTVGEASTIASIFGIPIGALFETYEAQDYAELATLANRLTALAADKAKLAERLTALDAEIASVQTQYDDLQQRVERNEEEGRLELQEELQIQRDYETMSYGDGV